MNEWARGLAAFGQGVFYGLAALGFGFVVSLAAAAIH